MKSNMLLVLALLLILSGCTKQGYKSIEEAMKHGGIQYKQIYHQYEVKNGIILFYENPSGGLDAGIVYKNDNRYKWGFGGGTVSFSSQMDVDWGWVNLDYNVNDEDKQYQLYYGIIQAQSINRLHIEDKGSNKYIDKDAEIVELQNGTKLWFALQDSYSEVYPGFILNGFSKDNKNVFHFE
ncbi:hypothetical protein [Bacillus sp. FJAT-28004]|uniref:hypothetical protein n=1 Tax=Bacillus sp. FJAT-28004 TaxID=1679165 RepID=UPI0006B59EF5|nr:hypothetical protein [Bacillus sp. FJAT-28004]